MTEERDIPPVLWRPSERDVERAAVTRFAGWVEATRAVRVTDSYDQLWRWSVDDLAGFWAAAWDYFDVQADGSPARVLTRREMPGSEWFPDVALNYAEHVLRRRNPSSLALQHATELHGPQPWTWGELSKQVARIAAGLRRLGVQRGDRVASYLPNVPETVAAFLATASLGAIWSSAAPEFGTRSVIDRFAQIEPKVLLAADGYVYGGKRFDRRRTIAELAAAMPSLERVVVLHRLDEQPVPGTLPWPELTRETAELRFERVPFQHPLWILYSSGTTGLPKPIVHGHGGMLLEHLKLAHLHVDAGEHDRLFWFTTTGWMMWNFLVGCLLTPASIVLYDGSPAGERLWQLAADAGATLFGTSASFIAACMKQAIEPRAGGRDLTSLRTVGSTGSPLAPEGFEWIYDRLGERVWLTSISGGTDVCTAFLAGVPTLPVHRGELQCRALGVDVQAWDPDGGPLTNEVGELVVAQPMPAMPVAFWGDADGSQLRDTYFAHYPGVWRHGDWIEITDRGTAIVFGRSDATINRGGVRMGTSEIYRAVLADERVLDALVVDVPRPGTDGWMPLFVVLREGETLDDELVAALRRRVAADCSPRHVPDTVEQVAAVPRTLSGKALEVPVKRILMGEPSERVVSRESLADPAALDAFVALARRWDVG